jgi:hypothetical protein
MTTFSLLPRTAFHRFDNLPQEASFESAENLLRVSNEHVHNGE